MHRGFDRHAFMLLGQPPFTTRKASSYHDLTCSVIVLAKRPPHQFASQVTKVAEWIPTGLTIIVTISRQSTVAETVPCLCSGALDAERDRRALTG